MNLETLVLPMKTEDNAFRAGLSRAVQLVEGFVEMVDKAVKETFKWADEMDSIQDIMGVNNRVAAALNFTIRKSGTDTATFTRALTILNKGLVDAHGRLDTTGKSLKKWGINVFDANGMLKDQEQLIRDVSLRYAEFSTQQQKVNFLTEVFGRSGADLIDFFDTLAAEGGIDAVTKKVEQLGLAIDPNRYEQFNRNLQELRLIGLGLAVSFTEKIMPALEGLIDWMMDTGIPGFNRFKDKIIGAFESGGISEALSVLDEEIATWLEGLDWEGWGTSFGDLLEKALTNGAGEIDVPKSLEALGEGITNFFESAIGEEALAGWQTGAAALDAEVEKWASGQESIFDTWGQMVINEVDQTMDTVRTTNASRLEEIKTDYNNWASDINATVDTWAANTTTAFSSWAAGTVSAIGTWAAETVTSINTTLSTLDMEIDNKLRDIAKTFFNRASRWANQMIAGFNGSKGGLFDAIRDMVNEINSILKRIMTSFRINVQVGTIGGGPGTGGNGRTGTGSNAAGGGTRPPAQNRASGGPVIGGQLYGINLDKEWFVANQNGRVEGRSDLTARISMDDMRTLVREQARILIPEMQKLIG